MLTNENIPKKSVAEFAADSISLVRKVHSSKQPLLLTDDGENAAVLLDSAEYALMAERMQMLEGVYVSQEQLRAGKGITHEKVEKDLLAKRRKAFGMWKDRTDLPDFDALRRQA